MCVFGMSIINHTVQCVASWHRYNMRGIIINSQVYFVVLILQISHIDSTPTLATNLITVLP